MDLGSFSRRRPGTCESLPAPPTPRSAPPSGLWGSGKAFEGQVLVYRGEVQGSASPLPLSSPELSPEGGSGDSRWTLMPEARGKGVAAQPRAGRPGTEPRQGTGASHPRQAPSATPASPALSWSRVVPETQFPLLSREDD